MERRHTSWNRLSQYHQHPQIKKEYERQPTEDTESVNSDPDCDDTESNSDPDCDDTESNSDPDWLRHQLYKMEKASL